MHIRATYQGELFDERDVEYLLGDGSEINIPEGVEKGGNFFIHGNVLMQRLHIKL